MALDDPERIKEIFASFGPIAVRRMFGGLGIFSQGTMFALVADGDLYFKVDEETIPAFRAERSSPFIYVARGRRIAMSYWRVPDRLLDEPDELADWARASLAAARRTAVVRPQRPRKPARKRNGGRRR